MTPVLKLQSFGGGPVTAVVLPEDDGGDNHEGHEEHEGWNLTIYPSA